MFNSVQMLPRPLSIMETPTEKNEAKPLSEIFSDKWEGIFTVDHFDQRTLSVVLENDAAPKNAAHNTTTQSIQSASEKLYAVNGNEFFKAISILERR